MSSVARFDNFRWENTDLLAYKEEGSHFKAITRQILFDGQQDTPCQLRYFEISPGGHSTLERHEHLHVVMVIRGRGDALIGEKIEFVALFDKVTISPHTWHQFQATSDEPLGFLCLVSCDRDRPHRPDPQEREQLLSNPSIANFIKL